MKRMLLVYTIISTLLLGVIANRFSISGNVLVVSAAPVVQAFKTEPVYRFRSRKGYTLYKTGATLPSGLSDSPWTNEGIVFHVPSGPNHTVHTRPVYQLTKSDVLGVRYAYTSDFNEADSFKGGPANKFGIGQWVNQGQVFYVSSDKTPQTVPLHKLYLPFRDTNPGKEFTGPVAGTDKPFYTTSDSEKASAISQGYTYQGIVGYVWLAPYPPPPAALPDLVIAQTDADEFSVTAIIRNQGKSNTKGIKYDVKLSVYDKAGKLLFSGKEAAPGLSPNQSNQVVFNTNGRSLYQTRYQIQIDTANALEESDENNNETAMLEGPRPKMKIKPVDPNYVQPPSLTLLQVKPGAAADSMLYTFNLTNWDSYPEEWFQEVPGNVLPAVLCGSQSTRERMTVTFVAIVGGHETIATCRAISKTSYKRILNLELKGQLAKPEKVYIILKDRLVGADYKSSAYPVGAFGIGDVLLPLGCKYFLGRISDFQCTKKTGFDACENLRKQGKPIVCRMAGQQDK